MQFFYYLSPPLGFLPKNQVCFKNIVAFLSTNAGFTEYQSWDSKQLKHWLKAHNINPPPAFSETQLKDLVRANWYNSATSWTKEQYHAAQHAFRDVKDDTFKCTVDPLSLLSPIMLDFFLAWDESQLRRFLLDQGIIAPQGPKESLVQSAKSV